MLTSEPLTVCPYNLFFVQDILGDALYEKGLQRRQGVGTLVRSQERKAAVILLINIFNRLSTDRFVSPPVYMGIPLFVLARDRSEHCCRPPGVQKERLSPGRTDPSASRRALPRSAPPLRRGPPCADSPMVCAGFGVDRCHVMSCHFMSCH